MKKRFILLLLFAIIFSFSTTAHAKQSVAKAPPIVQEKETVRKADMKAEFEEMQTKFDSLSETEKNQVYDLAEKIADLNVELIQKYGELNIISEEKVEKITEMFSERSKKLREDGKIIPGMFMPPFQSKEKCTINRVE